MGRAKIRNVYHLQSWIENALYFITRCLTGRYRSADIGSALQQVYLQQGIMTLSVASILMAITAQNLSQYLHIRVFEIKKACANGTHCDHNFVDYYFRPTDVYLAFDLLSGVTKRAISVLPSSPKSDLEVDGMMHHMLETWGRHLIIMPIEHLCGILVFAIDVVRRVLHCFLIFRDSAVMFGMMLMLVCLGAVRLTGLHLYFILIQTVNKMAQEINYRFEKVMIDNVMPMVICVEPPGGYFLVCVINELVILLQITFIMDYMDPA
ncbi:uncharacterized protein DEA37_0005480 [Paragonimus westermani]|uniref:Uncharacterized protein n=1 Tax=Paragonimus westermani TaxID=34504 RepID=A0A5J4NFK1_9TREM|nr:uncharacterized protein DEA37_0005480 [Paragonimus westermani]